MADVIKIATYLGNFKAALDCKHFVWLPWHIKLCMYVGW